jgi:hypothetical protein
MGGRMSADTRQQGGLLIAGHAGDPAGHLGRDEL